MGNFRFIDLKPSQETFLGAVTRGLSAKPKTLPAKLFYDQRGSRLFERITALEEYYPTRTEKKILEDAARKLKRLIRRDSTLVEFGAGSSEKVRILLDEVGRFSAYLPIDISRDYLKKEAKALAADHPGISVTAICADYTRPFSMPGDVPLGRHGVGFFPGSTIGNMTPESARGFLQNAGRLLGRGAGFIIGADLKKDPAILHAAYNDSKGLTAEFNKNVLRRINDELGGTFDLGGFRHRAFFNAVESRIEMHLESLADQTVKVGKKTFSFAKGETIHTENSYKFTVREFHDLVIAAGMIPVKAWWDGEALFSVHFLKVA